MALVSNTIVYKEDWQANLQERLSEPTKWKDICKVEYTDTKVLNNPYLTDPTVQTGTRSSPYLLQAITETTESITINTYKNLAQFIDRADLAQSGYMKQMEASDRQAVLLNEAIETSIYADYGSMTTFDNATLTGGAAGSITVSATNVDDIIRMLEQQIIANSGAALMQRNGAFIVWRPADWNFVRAFMMANGFSTADNALRNNGVSASLGGVDYMGFTHYTSNLLTAQHLMAGVKKTYHLGICRTTYGSVMVDANDPNLTSGISIVSRVDYKGIVWTKVKPVLFNIIVA